MADRADTSIVRFLTEKKYHPRSSRHGDALCGFLLTDLLSHCPAIATAAASGDLVYAMNWTVDPGSVDSWNTDLVLGPPTQATSSLEISKKGIARGEPREIWVAVDAKTIMTEHGKARRNRQRDLNSFQDILHRKNIRTIVGGLLIVNMAERFQTPLARQLEGITTHRNILRLVEEIVAMMGGLARSEPAVEKGGLEALGVIVVKHSNVEGDISELVVDPPAPSLSSPMSYESFLRDVCQAYSRRFG